MVLVELTICDQFKSHCHRREINYLSDQMIQLFAFKADFVSVTAMERIESFEPSAIGDEMINHEHYFRRNKRQLFVINSI